MIVDSLWWDHLCTFQDRAGSQDRAVYLKPTASFSCEHNSELHSGWKQGKQLYPKNHAMYKHWTCIILLLKTHTFILASILGRLQTKKAHKSLSDYRYSNSALHPTTSLSARGSCNHKKSAHSSRVMELNNAEEILSTVALKKRQGTVSKHRQNCLIL